MFEREIEELKAECEAIVEASLEEAGEAAVVENIASGDYNNVTGRLRRSNYYEIVRNGGKVSGLKIGNSAPYASNVESRGRMVITDGVLLAHKMLSK